MNLLFICNTNMQLINAIQIKTVLKPEDDADIIISDHSIGFEVVSDRLRELNIFKKVLYVETHEFDQNQSIFEDVRDIFSLCFGSAKKYRNLIWDNIPDYDELYFYNYDFLAQVIFNEMISRGNTTKVYRYEETLTSYQNLFKSINGQNNPGLRTKLYIKYCDIWNKNFLNSDKCLTGDFVYFPELYRGYVPSSYSVMQLPMLSRERLELINILNNIYNYNPTSNWIEQKYIYLASSFDVDGYDVQEQNLVLELGEIVGQENLIVKTHPRDRRTIYEDAGIAVNRYSAVPWELVLLNQDFSSHIFVSLNSGSMITGPAVMGDDYKGFYLYPMLNTNKLDVDVISMIDGVDKILSQLHRIGKVKRCVKISDFDEILH